MDVPGPAAVPGAGFSQEPSTGKSHLPTVGAQCEPVKQ